MIHPINPANFEATSYFSVRAVAAALILQAAIFFVRFRQNLASRLGASFLIAAAVQALGEDWFVLLPRPLSVIAQVIGTCPTPLFWLFARAWFDDHFKLNMLDIVVLACFAAVGSGDALGAYQADVASVADLSLDGIGGILILHALALAWTGRKDDLVEPRRQIRSRFVCGVSVLILWWLAAEVLVIGFGVSKIGLATVSSIFVMITTALMNLQLFGPRCPDLFPTPISADNARKNIASTAAKSFPQYEALSQALKDLMQNERLYRDPDLTIGRLAARMDLPEHRLRRMINDGLGFRNFNEFLNNYRLDDVRSALGDQEQSDVPIVTIALDAGFGSLPAFNRVFKTTCGETPTSFRKRHSLEASNRKSDIATRPPTQAACPRRVF